MLSQNYYMMDELLAGLPKAIKREDVQTAVFIVGELFKSMKEEEFVSELKKLENVSDSEVFPKSDYYKFICDIMNVEGTRALKSYFNHSSKKLETRRKITIPKYALTDKTERGQGVDTTCYLFDNFPMAKDWSEDEIAKSHGVIVKEVAINDILEDIICDGTEVEEKEKSIEKKPVEKTASAKPTQRIIVRKTPKQLPAVEFKPETMYSDKAPYMLAIPRAIPTMYQDGKFIKSISECMWNDNVQNYTYDVQKIKKLLNIKPLDVTHSTSFIKGVVYHCFATPNQGGKCVTNGIYIDRVKHNLKDLNSITLVREQFKPPVILMLFRKLVGCTVHTSSILQNTDTKEYVLTLEVLRHVNKNNRLIADPYHQRVELRDHMKRYGARYVTMLAEWRELLKDASLERYGIDLQYNITKLSDQLNRCILY